MELDSFGVVTEFGVALAGFSAVATALSQQRGAIAALDRFRTLNMLMWSLGAAFVSTFPYVAYGFGAEGVAVWRSSSLGFVVVLAVGTAVPIVLRRRLEPRDRRQLSPVLWVLAVGGNSVLIVFQAANVSGLLGAPSPGPILASLVWLLFFAALLFVRMLVNRPSAPAA